MVVVVDLCNMMGNDSYVNEYYIWYEIDGESGVELLVDYVICDVWVVWDIVLIVGSIEVVDVVMDELIVIFVINGWVVGIVGEEVVVLIVKNNFMNMCDGLVLDDIICGIGLGGI